MCNSKDINITPITPATFSSSQIHKDKHITYNYFYYNKNLTQNSPTPNLTSKSN